MKQTLASAILMALFGTAKRFEVPAPEYSRPKNSRTPRSRLPGLEMPAGSKMARQEAEHRLGVRRPV